MRDAACVVNLVSSRACELGTRGCDVRHSDAAANRDDVLWEVRSAKNSAQGTADVLRGIPAFFSTYSVLDGIARKLERAERLLTENGHVEALLRENERLRGALTEIADHPGLAFMHERTWRDIAKEALRDNA